VTDTEQDRREQRALLWAFWVGLLVSTGAECLLFAMMEPVGSSPVGVASTVLGTMATLMLGAAWWAGRSRVGGGGVPTGLIVWLLLKGVSVLGLVAYQLTATHWLFWPFWVTFLAGMLWWWPGRLAASG